MSEWDEKYRDLDDQNRKSTVFNYVGGIISISGIFPLFYFLNGISESVVPKEFRWESLIIAFIILPIGIYIWKKAGKLKLETNENNFLIFWKTYKMLEKFSERKKDVDMNNAITSVNKIKDIFSDWFTDVTPKSISTLTDPIVDNLNNKIIPLVEEKNFPEISSLSTGCMNEALNLYKKEIDQDFLKRFQERLDGFPEPAKKEVIEIKKPSRWQEYPILKVFWIGIVAGIILFFSLTTYMEMDSGQALIGSFMGGIGLTAMILQGVKKK